MKKIKEAYDLNELQISFAYLTDGCGKKIENPKMLKIEYGGKILAMFTVSGTIDAFKKYNDWLER